MATTNDTVILPLKVAKDIEPEKTWEGITNPDDFLNYCARRLGVDVSQFSQFQDLIYSPIEPSGTDRNKLWIKTEGVAAIGIPAGSQYKMIWEYPPNIPLLWITGERLPNGMRRLTNQETENYGLTNPTNINYYYVINEVTV